MPDLHVQTILNKNNTEVKSKEWWHIFEWGVFRTSQASTLTQVAYNINFKKIFALYLVEVALTSFLGVKERLWRSFAYLSVVNSHKNRKVRKNKLWYDFIETYFQNINHSQGHYT